MFDAELETKIKEESLAAFEAESKIIDWMLAGYNEDSLNPIVLKEYVKNRINASLQQIGFTQVFEVDETLLEKCQWMEEELHGNTMTDFFHQKPVDYAKSAAVYSEDSLF